MRYFALATDFDGTLAHEGVVAPRAIAALERLRKSDRFLFLVTGRLVEDLQAVFPRLELFDAVVAENGAVLYDPATAQTTLLASPLPQELPRLLAARGVPLEGVGRVIVATREPHERALLQAIRDLGLEVQLIFNKGAVMALPSGINKAVGLSAALARFKLSPHNAAGVGDAENDHAFLELCECSAATANALDSIKAQADVVLTQPDGAGVEELAAKLYEDDLAGLCVRRSVPLARTPAAQEIAIESYVSGTMLFAGTSGGGKSTAALGLLERLTARGYQICVVDPEGDYEAFGGAIVLGDAQTIPTLDEIANVLDQPERSAIVSLLGVELRDRPAFIDRLLPALFSCRARYGRPHWIVLDEAHHLFPRERTPDAVLARDLYSVLAVTTDPQILAPSLLDTVATIVAFGRDAARTIERATRMPLQRPALPVDGQALVWNRATPERTALVEIIEPQTEKRRHRRKYATGELAPEKSFFFTGPDSKMNLRANNLTAFAAIAEGIDEQTWRFHLERGDYARWFSARSATTS